MLGVAQPDDSEMDLEDELLHMSPLPTIVSPLTEPVEALQVSPSLYPELAVPAQPDPVPSVELRDVSLREANKRPTIDLFPSFEISPAQSYYDTATSPITSDLQDDSGYLLLDIAADADLLLGDPSDLQLLTLPLLPVPVADGSDPVLVGTPSVGEPDLVPAVVPPDLSQEGPFDVDRTPSGRQTLPGVSVPDDVIRCYRPSRSESGIWTTSARPSVSRVCGSA